MSQNSIGRILNLCILTFTLFILYSNVCHGKTIVVDDDHEIWAEYHSIQNALDDSLINDTIRVYCGTYFEELIINKSIQLIGNGSSTTIINGSGCEDIIQIPSSTICNVQIKGFSVTGNKGFAGHGILAGGINISIDNCTVENIYGHGISVVAINSQITNCIIRNCTLQGILPARTNNISISNCLLDSNSACGIYSHNIERLQINNCNFIQNGRGISIYENNENITIKGCYFEGNHFSISMSNNGKYNSISNCIFSNNSYGIDLTDCSDSIIDHCTIIGGIYGIQVRYGSNNLINSTTTSNSYHGIRMSMQTRENTILNCTFINHWVGVWLTGVKEMSIYGSVFKDCSNSIDCSEPNEFFHFNLTNCTNNGKLILYGKNITQRVMKGSYSQIILVNCIKINIQLDNNITLRMPMIIIRCNSINISNLEFEGLGTGGKIIECQDLLIQKCHFINSSVECVDSQGLTILNCYFDHCNPFGIQILQAANITINNCQFRHSERGGLNIQHSKIITVSNCNFLVNGICLEWLNLTELFSLSIMNCTINGLPIICLKNSTSNPVFSDIGQLILINCSKIEINNFVLNYSSFGISCLYSNDISIINCNIRENNYGIYLKKSTDISIIRSEFYNNIIGLYAEDSEQIVIADCILSSNDYGLRTFYCNYTYLMDSIIINNSQNGICLFQTCTSIFKGNTICNNGDSGILVTQGSNWNSFSSNNISNNKGYGISISDSNENEVHHNNFLDNDAFPQAYDNIGNSWDDGTTGNYWSDHGGTGEYEIAGLLITDKHPVDTAFTIRVEKKNDTNPLSLWVMSTIIIILLIILLILINRGIYIRK